MKIKISEDELRDEIITFWQMLESRPSLAAFNTAKLVEEIGGRNVLAAIDSIHARHIFIPVPKCDVNCLLWRSASVTLSKVNLREDQFNDQTWLDLHCKDVELEAVFVRLSAALIVGLRETPFCQVEMVTLDALERWMDLFGKGGGLEISIIGLVAELLILESIAIKNSKKALERWQGPLGGRHDFRLGLHAIEVKGTTRRVGHQVQIHGIDQMLPPKGGQLFLSFVRLEKVPNGSISIASLTRRLIGLGVNEKELLDNLFTKGILNLDSNASNVAFEQTELICYQVDKSFPRIIPNSFVEGCAPRGVLGLTYTVDLGSMQCLPNDAFQNIILSLAS